MLEGEGLVELRLNRSPVVCRIDEKFAADQYDFRALLEGNAAYRAAQRNMDVSELEAILFKFCENLSIVSQAEFTQFNQKFHFSIWRAADSETLYKHLIRCWNIPSEGQTIPSIPQRFASTAEHSTILQRIKEGNAEQARAMMEQHIMNSLKNLNECYR